MPSTFGGLLIFVAFLTPGFIYYIQRRRWVPQRSESSLVETARLVSISVLTNLIAFGVFAFYRWRDPHHAPDVNLIATTGWQYVRARPGYMLLWAALFVVASSILAFGLAALPKLGLSLKWLSPDIVDESSWYYALADEVPKGKRTFVGLDLRDGTYISGYVDWFSTELDEVADRDITLVAAVHAPLIFKRDGNPETLDAERMIVSARDIVRMYVSYIPVPIAPKKKHWWNSRREATKNEVVVLDAGEAVE
jgi:hypothetical protein